MKQNASESSTSESIADRTKELVCEQRDRLNRQTDKLFAGLLVFEYFAGLVAALWIAPYTWAGDERQFHPHLWAAGVLGFVIISFPIHLALVHPGRCFTRHAIAFAQMAMSALLIHLTGGRIETHFHVFGSLAFLAFYRDWRVLITASAVTAADHLVRGVVWPQSVYGIEVASQWRWLEHAGWVIFEDLFLILSCLRSNRETQAIAERQAQLEAIKDEVQQRTAELQMIFDTVPALIFYKDREHRLVRVNEAHARCYGLPKEKIEGKTDAELGSPYASEYMQCDLNVMTTGEPLRGIIEQFHTPTGIRWIQTEKVPHRDVHGNIVGLVGLAIDITERKQAEERLRESEHNLAEAQHIAGLGSWSLELSNREDLNRNPLRWSDEVFRIFGYEPGEIDVCNETFFSAAHPDDRSRIQEAVATALRERTRYSIDHRICLPNGTERIVHEESDICYDEATGQPIRMAGTIQDVTERKRAEEAVASANAQLAGVLNAATQVAIIATDVNGTITVFNSGAENMLGYSADEMVGKRTPEIIHLQDEIAARGEELSREFGYRVAGFDVFVATVHQCKYDRREWTYVRKDGSHFTVNLVVTAVWNSTGEITGCLGVAEDITVRKQAERQLVVAREKAEQAARVKSEFLANMSHEIRTPMNGIIGMTDLALGTVLTTDQREYLETVKSSADSLLRIINDILDFSKIEAGKLELDPSPFRLRESLGDAMKTLALRAHGKNLELVWHVPPDVPDGLLGDIGRLRQVLVNLVGNAVKFTERGEVGVTVEMESRDDSCARLRFSVHDTGIGIPWDKQALIFEAFSQADASTTRFHGGTGLGLSISRQIVKLMGGELSVQSEEGQGSTFYFTIELPIALDWTLDGADAGLEGVPVLVVDDNDTNRRILEGMLRDWKMQPTAVASGPAALEAMLCAEMEGRPFALVLTDCHMPYMDGFMFVEELKKYPELAGTTIMMLTSEAPQGTFDRCREMGIAITLLKPVKQSELQQAVTTCLGNVRRTSGARISACGSGPTTLERRLRVLLAEDNLVNQRVAVRMLEKQGHEVQIVGNGRLALEAISAGTFDVVLMDVQMPVLDGLETVAALRQREQSTGRRVPVIAMTAHAMSGDRERCLAAGMDDYVSKPIHAALLSAALARVTADPRAADRLNCDGALPANAPDSSDVQEAIYDRNATLERVDGDGDFLKELTEVFLETMPDMLNELKAAVNQNDMASVGRLAHALKGSLGNFAAHPSFKAARHLERISCEGDLLSVKLAYQELTRQLERLNDVLRREVARCHTNPTEQCERELSISGGCAEMNAI